MASILRKSPPICLGISVVRIILGKLRLTKDYVGQTVKMQDGQEYTIFRHISNHLLPQDSLTMVFIVRFKFARLSHNANKIASIIPMLLITGFPGFNTKMYAVNFQNGYWQGMYQWKSENALEEYKRSIVFKIMNKRAIEKSMSSNEFSDQELLEYIEKIKIS